MIFLKKTLGVNSKRLTVAVRKECVHFPLEVQQKELLLIWCLLKLPADSPLHIVYEKIFHE